MRRLAALLTALATLGATPSSATSTTRADFSDLWWNAAESGWGAHVTLQDDVIFMVLYVYDAERQPRFFVAPGLRITDFPAGPENTFGGPLYSTQGPAFAGAFDPARVIPREVGSARLSFASPGFATLTYAVDGVTITKQITRQSWRAPSLAGEYKGGVFATATANTCPMGLPTIAYAGSLSIAQAGDVVTISAAVAPGFADTGACRYSGRLVQQGSLASISGGTYTCEFSNEITSAGTFDLTAIEIGPSGFGGRYSALEGPACRHTGHLGGILRGYGELPPPPPPPPPPPDPDD